MITIVIHVNVSPAHPKYSAQERTLSHNKFAPVNASKIAFRTEQCNNKNALCACLIHFNKILFKNEKNKFPKLEITVIIQINSTPIK
jgi:hypothetical protein